MPIQDSVSRHPERARIERDLALNIPLRRLAKKYNLSKDSLCRAKKRLPPQLKAALAGHALRPAEDLEKLRTEESEGLLSHLAAQRARLLLAQDAAAEVEQYGLVAQLASGIHRNLELTGKLVGEFAQHSVHTTISILVQPEYLQMRSELLRALAPFPEAKKAVAAVLHGVETSAAQQPSQRLLEARKGETDAGS
jgi:hypothetical protein